MQDAERLCRLNRYTGSGDGEAAAEQIAERMEDLGIHVDRERYQMYRSLPGKASLRILGAGQEEDIPLTPYVYSGTAQDLEAELVFDGISVAGGCSQREQRARMAGFSGKEIPYVDAAKINENEDLQFLSTPSMKIVMFYLDTKSDAPLKDKRVRQAIEYAIDKEGIVQAVCYGYGTVAYAIVPDSVTEYKEVKEPHEYNLEKAKELMKEAGYENGFSMEIWTSSVQTNTEICQVVQEQLAAINIEAEILVQDANTIDTRVDAGDEYGLSLHFYSCNSGHAEYTLSNILPTGTLRNDSRFSNPEYDATYEEWLVTVDEKKRDELLTRMYEIQNEETPVIPLYNEVKILGATKNLDGFQLSRIGAHEYTNAVVYEE